MHPLVEASRDLFIADAQKRNEAAARGEGNLGSWDRLWQASGSRPKPNPQSNEHDVFGDSQDLLIKADAFYLPCIGTPPAFLLVLTRLIVRFLMLGGVCSSC